MYFHVVMVALQSKKTMDITKNIVNSAMNKNRSKKTKIIVIGTKIIRGKII